MSEHLLSEIHDGVGSIVFNRPERLNAVSPEMAEELVRAIHRFERNPEVRCVLIRGEGSSFTSGGDVKSFYEALVEDREAHAGRMEQRVVNGHLSMHRLRRMPKPVIVVAQGITAGLGVSLLCCADLAIAADDAEFVMAYRHIGLSVDGGVSYFLPRIVGERRALQITLMGERITAQQGKEWGLVNWTVPQADLLKEATRIASSLAQGPTTALAAAKKLLRQSLETGWDEQSAAEAFLLAETVASDDHLEGVTAFVEKRRARFTGN